MRALTKITATIIVMSLTAQGLSFAQPGWRTNTYDRCVERAARQGLNVKSTSGRKFVNRCMQRDTTQRDTPRPSRNCPDDPKARSAYPAWMCP